MPPSHRALNLLRESHCLHLALLVTLHEQWRLVSPDGDGVRILIALLVVSIVLFALQRLTPSSAVESRHYRPADQGDSLLLLPPFLFASLAFVHQSTPALGLPLLASFTSSSIVALWHVLPHTVDENAPGRLPLLALGACGGLLAMVVRASTVGLDDQTTVAALVPVFLCCYSIAFAATRRWSQSFTHFEYSLLLQGCSYAFNSSIFYAVHTHTVSPTIPMVIISIGLSLCILRALGSFSVQLAPFIIILVIAFSFVAIPWFLGAENEVQYIFRLLSRTSCQLLFVYWLGALGSFFLALWLYSAFVFSLELTVIRKLFHLLAMLIFLPGLAVDPEWTRHCAILVLFGFVLLEVVRISRSSPLSSLLENGMSMFIDSKDSGPVVVTHMYLLVGCLLPAFLLPNSSTLVISSGTLFLGVGDSLASIFGKKWGHHYWLGTSPKSLEGTAAAVAGMVVMLVSYRNATATTLLSTILICVLEGVLTQVDNLVIPLLYCIMLWAAAGG